MSLYPAHREADVALRDGSTVHVRPVREEDEGALGAFYASLSERSRWFRFMSSWANVGDFAAKAVDVDHRDRYSLVVTTGADHSIVGHAVYFRVDDDRAEVAFAVADGWQGRGLGTILLGHLAEAAQENGIGVFEAITLPENHQMIEVFRQSGFSVKMRSGPGEIAVEFPTSLSHDAVERFERREQTASEAAVRALLWPRSVAVIGASRRRGTIGGEVLHNLIAAGFNGPVYPVNPTSEVVQSVLAYPSVTDISGPVDLGVIVTPADRVLEVAAQCATKGVRGLVVISSGFSEVGEEGLERQRALLRVCRESGMRLIGPNCLGVMNTDPSVRLNATFGPEMAPRGNVGFMSQSGALGLAVIDRAATLGLGLSSFVSVGNKADISGNDLMDYWEADPATGLILLYLESFGNPRKFARVARRVGRSKPIVAVKSGRSSAGARATSSHTGALLAASDVTVDALFRQTGVVRCDTLPELFDVAALLANQPAPRGRRVVIVTNAGGPGILCADVCEAEGLTVAPLSGDVLERLSAFLPAEAALHNPIDMIASASADDYRRTIEAVLEEPDVDAVIVIFIPPLVTRAEDVAAAIRDAGAHAARREIPIVSVFMSAQGVPAALRDSEIRIPSYAFPEDAALALARATRYGAWRGAPEGRMPSFDDIRVDEAAAVLASALARGPHWLAPDEVSRILGCYGLRLPGWRLVRSPEEVGEAAVAIGTPVAVKAAGRDVIHKTDVGGVRLGLRTPEDARDAAEEVERAVSGDGKQVEGFLVQEMIPTGVEMLVGVVHDPLFGPVLALGAGGTAVELVRDVSIRITPITVEDAGEMVRSLATFPLLTGYRGAPPADVDALEETLLRVSLLVENHPEIAEMDCNPVIVLPEGAVVVDARIRIEMPTPPLPLGARRPI